MKRYGVLIKLLLGANFALMHFSRARFAVYYIGMYVQAVEPMLAWNVSCSIQRGLKSALLEYVALLR